MITVPTAEFTGILTDALPFIARDEDVPALTCVRLQWDGAMLHATATDRFRVAISSWHPEDRPDGDAQDDLFTVWGGTDQSWSAMLDGDDAKRVAAAYKLGVDHGRVPVTIEWSPGRLCFDRSRDTGHSAITIVVSCAEHPHYPDVRQMLVDNSVAQEIRSVAYTSKLLADFAKVRQRGPLELTFTGAERLTHIAIGKRFVGAISPVKLGGAP